MSSSRSKWISYNRDRSTYAKTFSSVPSRVGKVNSRRHSLRDSWYLVPQIVWQRILTANPSANLKWTPCTNAVMHFMRRTVMMQRAWAVRRQACSDSNWSRRRSNPRRERDLLSGGEREQCRVVIGHLSCIYCCQQLSSREVNITLQCYCPPSTLRKVR